MVALLEAEVAHLKAQLLASPDTKDTQLLNYRQRTVVLGVQLNKAVQAKRTYEGVVQKLLDFTRVRRPGSLVVPRPPRLPLLMHRGGTGHAGLADAGWQALARGGPAVRPPLLSPGEGEFIFF